MTTPTPTAPIPAVSRRSLLAGAGAAPLAVALAHGKADAHPAPQRRPTPPARPSRARLTNLAHLDALCHTVRVSPVAGHTTYRLAAEPALTLLWVYANANADGSFTPVGGGTHDAATDTWGQGAHDADDIARAAVVYLRHFTQFGERSSLRKAREQLRAMSYFQTLTGAHAGEFLLWMQPDGTLNPTPTPADSPNPADSDDSYWTARCVWALGEGYAVFRDEEPAFARFLAERMELALAALRRDTPATGTWTTLHGVRVPGWFITKGADATSEAVLGLAAYVRSSRSAAARRQLRSWADAIAAFHAGSARQWPYRALLPWAGSLDDWHAWGAEMASALAAAGTALHDPSLMAPAVGDTAGFTAQLLTSTGPVNGLLPLPLDKVQIAYGADCRVRGCIDTGVATGRAGLLQLGGIAAGWFFGANTAGVPAYNPATGATVDGIEADGRVNPNSGAESTIHGLLTMLALDAHPELATLARRSATVTHRDGLTVLEAEAATLTGPASVQTPAAAWTGESQWSGQQVVAASGATLTWTLPRLGDELVVEPVALLQPGSAARTSFRADGRLLGTLDHGHVGPQGDAASADRLTAVALPRDARPGSTTLVASVAGGTAQLDAVAIRPVVATATFTGQGASGQGSATALLTSRSAHPEHRTVALAGSGVATVRSHDAQGRLVASTRTGSSRSTGGVRVLVAPGGFTVVTRG